MYKLFVENFIGGSSRAVAATVITFDCKSDADKAFEILGTHEPEVGRRSVIKLY